MGKLCTIGLHGNRGGVRSRSGISEKPGGATVIRDSLLPGGGRSAAGRWLGDVGSHAAAQDPEPLSPPGKSERNAAARGRACPALPVGAALIRPFLHVHDGDCQPCPAGLPDWSKQREGLDHDSGSSEAENDRERLGTMAISTLQVWGAGSSVSKGRALRSGANGLIPVILAAQEQTSGGLWLEASRGKQVVTPYLQSVHR
jgi:hypothetical protein